MLTLRLIGDVHGKSAEYIKLATTDFTIQVGDLGFDYDFLKSLDPARHKVLAGNHDNYDRWGTDKFIHMQTGHFLGDYGIYELGGFGKIFFLRGGYSIDWRYRTPGKSWWADEELSHRDMELALGLYREVKPTFVVSHECPASIIEPAFGAKLWDGELLRPSRTASLLDAMWQSHRPQDWVFGHHHKRWSCELEGTRFLCLEELGYVDLPLESY